MKVILIGANGYIGSKVADMLDNSDITFLPLDNLIRETEKIHKDLEVISYQDLTSDFLNEYSDCIFLGGHSSVKMSIDDEEGAFNNNFLDLIELRNKFKGRLIYASSGSIYSRSTAEICNEDSPTMVPDNMYDYTKIAFDNYLRMSKFNGVGLRFGTVNGWSKSLRKDLMINYMYETARDHKKITVLNMKYFRPILFIDDLVNGIEKILDSDISDGIFNMCSFNSSIGEIAEEAASLLEVDLYKEDDTGTYNFLMDNSKFENTFNFQFSGNISKIIESLVNEI